MRFFVSTLGLCAAFLVGCAQTTTTVAQQPTTPAPVLTDNTQQAQQPAEEETEPAVELQHVRFDSSWTVTQSDITDDGGLVLALSSNAEPNVTARIIIGESGCSWTAAWHVNYYRDGLQCVHAAQWTVNSHDERTILQLVDDESDTSADLVVNGLRVSWPRHVARDLQMAINPMTRTGICN